MNAHTVYKKLQTHYGPQKWWPIYIADPKITKYRRQHNLSYGVPYRKLADFKNEFRDPYFEIALGAILTQNVSWKNVAQAILNLYEAGCLRPEIMANYPLNQLEQLLFTTRYYTQKARAVKEFSNWLVNNFHGDISKLRRFPVHETRSRLLEQRGIGKETADSILLYALAKPIFMVDIYTKRLCEAFEVVFNKYDDYRCFFERQLEILDLEEEDQVKLYQEYHALIVQSGQEQHAMIARNHYEKQH